MSKLTISKERLQRGAPGEIATIKHLESNKKITEIHDLRDDAEYWYKDIDFKAIRKDGTSFYIETKTITGTHINLNIQVFKIDTTQKEQFRPGWFYFSEAKYLFVYQTNTRLLYIFDFVVIREWYDNERITNTKFKTKIFEDPDNKNKYSVNVLIPIAEIRDMAHAIHKIEI